MPTSLPLTAPHRRRLREVWRSSGWPCQDMLEVDLLAAGLLDRVRDADGRETLRARIADAAHPNGERWAMAMPDVFSVRHTSVAGYLQPEVHEIKVRRADLQSDLRRPAKRAAYLGMAGACWYVLAEGIGGADEIPADCGVMLARGPAFATLEVVRAAPARAMPFEAGLPFALWMALARATPVAAGDDDAQRVLGAPPE